MSRVALRKAFYGLPSYIGMAHPGNQWQLALRFALTQDYTATWRVTVCFPHPSGSGRPIKAVVYREGEVPNEAFGTIIQGLDEAKQFVGDFTVETVMP